MRLGPWELGIGVFLFLPALAAYFVPTIIAAFRRAKDMVGIVLLNVLAGWTFIGWVIALVWSIVGQKNIAIAATVPSATQEKFCAKCGAKATIGDRYCSKCGTELPQG
jgi:ribosomal protein L40E